MHADNAAIFHSFLVLSLLLSLLKVPIYTCRYILQVASCRLQVQNVTKIRKTEELGYSSGHIHYVVLSFTSLDAGREGGTFCCEIANSIM